MVENICMLKDRLHQVLLRASVDKKALQKHLGISIQAVDKLLDGRTKCMAAINNSHAAQYLGVSSDWLATGEGSMALSSDWPFALFSLRDYQSLSTADQEAVEDFAYAKIGRNKQRRAA